MEHYFSLHGITDEFTKIHYNVLYLDLELWKWWQWCRNACQGYVSWTQVIFELYERLENDTHNLGRLTKLKQYGKMEDFITSFPNRGYDGFLIMRILYCWPQG
jgi:hypothetical protein